jgi:type III pantothenate kinase
MKVVYVADVGNSRIKWGRCGPERVEEVASLPAEDASAWERKIQEWPFVGLPWAVSGVHPERVGRLTAWLQQRGQIVIALTSWLQLPLRISVDFPSQVGMDRLLNAVAAKHRVQREVPIVIIDAGSAVTVDWVDDTGAFRGGAIFPGFGLMAKALHTYTAQLPEIDVPPPANPPLPGANTRAAIEAGVFWAAAGGVRALIRQFIGLPSPGRRVLRRQFVGLPSIGPPPEVFLTGGDANVLAAVLETGICLWPEMTLEGIRLTAESLP